MLQRLVANLIDNAERHGAPPVTVEVFVDEKTRQAVLRVADRGPGIADPARLRRAFERGDAARGTQGAGLGLAIVDRIAERHGGSVEIASPGSVGTAVTIRLPLAATA
jgi:two-component system osmolarity sensor histidine kinase EnvZ